MGLKRFKCLMLIQAIAILTVGESSPVFAAEGYKPLTNEEIKQHLDKEQSGLKYEPTVLDVKNQAQLEKLFALADEIQRHKLLYSYLNDQFADMLVISKDLQMQFGWPEKAKGLSFTQIVYLLNNLPQGFLDLLDSYLKSVTIENSKTESISKLRRELKKKFKELLLSQDIASKFKNMNDPTEPMVVRINDNKDGYEEAKLFVNHPSLVTDEKGNKVVKSGDDLKQVVLDFIKGAKQNIYYNVFEFNLIDVAQELVAQNKKGVRIIGGIDKTTLDMATTNRAVYDYLHSQESKTLNTIAVESVGLNHQKILVRDVGTPNAAVLFLSGNFTQSCIGPEGDLVNLPNQIRPVESLPNANHALLVKGQLPALITKHELEKTLISKIKGQSEFPISGSFLLFGPRNGARERPTMVISFSPNGGMGEVNRDLIKRIILGTKGSIKTMHFAFSSPDLEQAIISRAEQSKNLGNLLNFQAVGDPPFALRDWSVFLHLSGFRVNPETQLYEIDPTNPIVKSLTPEELKQWQNRIRVDLGTFGEFHKIINNENHKISVKLHHKVFIFPEDRISIVGTSFNPSNNAESNQEQLIIVKDEGITRQITEAFDYLYYKSRISVAQRANSKNKYLIKPTDFEIRTMGNQCGKVFSLFK